eukprot:scaffold3608_cov114-Skeletonema_dohrnii-CCMP3373.AAC.3
MEMREESLSAIAIKDHVNKSSCFLHAIFIIAPLCCHHRHIESKAKQYHESITNHRRPFGVVIITSPIIFSGFSRVSFGRRKSSGLYKKQRQWPSTAADWSTLLYNH